MPNETELRLQLRDAKRDLTAANKRLAEISENLRAAMVPKLVRGIRVCEQGYTQPGTVINPADDDDGFVEVRWDRGGQGRVKAEFLRIVSNAPPQTLQWPIEVTVLIDEGNGQIARVYTSPQTEEDKKWYEENYYKFVPAHLIRG